MSNIQDTANQALQQMLTMAVNGLQGAVDFSKAQIPDVIHQMLVWNAVSSALVQLFCLVVISYFVYFASKILKSSRYDGETIALVTIFGIFLAGIPLVVLLLSFDWVEILVAPKYYILQQAAHLVKS